MKRKPDYKLRLRDRDTKSTSPRSGVGWKNDDGSISLQLDIGVVIRWDDPVNITLFSFENEKEVSNG